MTKSLKLIAAIALCICFAHNAHYSQTQNPDASQAVVRLRSKIELKKPRRVLFSPASKLLAVRREDDSIQIIDTRDGREQSVLQLPDKYAYGIQWTTDGLRLLVVDSKSVAVWDARHGTRVSTPIE